MKVTVSAPGKIHLMGEHAVVYGKPALLAAVNLRTYVSVEERNGQSGLPWYIQHVIDTVKKSAQIEKLPDMAITVRSEVPEGYHLGSSAAIAVAIAGAILSFLGKTWDLDLINDIAYEAEKKIHGNPSGGDNTAITFGGFLWFRKELDFLKLKTPLPVVLSQKLNHFFLIDTGRPKESTGEMVGYVSTKYKVQSAKYEKLFSDNEKQTKRLAMAIKEGSEVELIGAIRAGERTLEGMGVVSSKVIPLIRNIEKAGGAAKILGGGGRKEGVGFLLGYHHEPEQLAEKYHLKINKIILGEEGVRLEPS